MEEKVVFETRPSYVVLTPHFIAMIFIIGFFTIWKPLITILTTKLKVTTKRIEGKVGFIRTERMDSRIGQISSVKVSQGLVGKMFNYGTININTAGGDYEFKYMVNPEEIRNKINYVIDNAHT